MRFSDCDKNNLDIIATQLDKDGKKFIFLFSNGLNTEANRIKTFSGGKSGDNVILIDIDGQQYVLKIFSKGDRQKTLANAKEIDIHKNVMKIFSKDYMPIPKIYSYGYIKEIEFDKKKNNEDDLRYIIMELLNPVYELYDYVREKCAGEKVTYNLDIYRIFLEIFYFIGNIIMNGITHCDLHLKNIMIVPKESHTLSFSNITNSDFKLEVKNYSIKVIDFGISDENDVPCDKIRRTTSSLNELLKTCGGSSELLNLMKGELKLINHENADLNFLSKIVNIFSLFDQRFLSIDTDKILEYSYEIYDIKNKKEKKRILTNILNLFL